MQAKRIKMWLDVSFNFYLVDDAVEVVDLDAQRTKSIKDNKYNPSTSSVICHNSGFFDVQQPVLVKLSGVAENAEFIR